MVQLLLCVVLLIPLVALPIVAFLLLSTTLGIVAAVVGAVLAVPLLVSAAGHVDLMRMRARYGLSDEELAEFMRLVPALVLRSQSAGQSAAQCKRAAQQTAADMIRERRNHPEPTGDRALDATTADQRPVKG